MCCVQVWMLLCSSTHSSSGSCVGWTCYSYPPRNSNSSACTRSDTRSSSWKPWRTSALWYLFYFNYFCHVTVFDYIIHVCLEASRNFRENKHTSADVLISLTYCAQMCTWSIREKIIPKPCLGLENVWDKCLTNSNQLSCSATQAFLFMSIFGSEVFLATLYLGMRE